MPDPSPTAQIIDNHNRTRQNILTALNALDEPHDPTMATSNLAFTLGDAARRYRIRTANEAAASAAINSELDDIRRHLTEALTAIGEPHDHIDTDAQVAAAAAAALTHWHARAVRAERERDQSMTAALAARSTTPRPLPLTAGTYRHDGRDYAIVVDTKGRTVTIDATGDGTSTEITGTVILDDAASLIAMSDALRAIAAHITERLTA